MSLDYTVNALLASVKQRAMTADNQNLLQDSDIVRIASEELQAVILPLIISVKEEYYVTNQNVPFINGQLGYTLPQRAIGTKLRDALLIDFNSNQVLLNYINPEDLKSSWAYAPYQFGFYPMDNQIILVLGNLVSAVGNYQFVQMKYFRRPNTLCTTDSTGKAGQITNINPVTREVTLSFVPTAWTTTTTFDVINSMPPFQSRGDDQTISNISGFILTFNSLPAGMIVGDWVSEANFSPIPQIPVECQRLLECLTAARVLQYTGDPSFQVAQAQATQMQRDLIQLITPRVDGSPRKIPNRNRLWGWWLLLLSFLPVALLIK